MKLRYKILHLVMWSCFLFVFLSCSEKKKEEKITNHVEQSLTETGELEASKIFPIVMPRFGRYWYRMKLIGIIDHGSKVQKGDSLLCFDPTDVENFIVNSQNSLELQDAALSKMRINMQNKIQDMQSDLKSEEASFALKKLSMKYATFESETQRKIDSIQYLQSEIRMAKIKKQLYYSRIIDSCDFKIQTIRVKQLKDDIKEAKDVIPTLTFFSPTSGIFQIAKKRRSREMLKVGDDIRFGQEIGNVPVLTWMKINTQVNEIDITKIHVGQNVIVRLDASPDLSFNAKVSSISALCHELSGKDNRKVFDVVVKLLDSDERLKPGMTVSCEFIIDKNIKNAN